MRKTPSVYEKQHDERAEAILSATKKLALEKGLAGVTMGAIAKRAKVSRQRLYLYFPNTDSLFYRIQIQDMSAFTKDIEGALSRMPQTSERENLLSLTRHLFDYRRAHGEDFLFTSEFDTYYRGRRAEEALRREYEATYKGLVFQKAILSFFEEGVKNGEFRKDLVPEDATFFWANTLQLIHERLSIFEANGEEHGIEEAERFEREALKALTSYLL
jgi:AcrR family transcriptional regulator